jgi:hypothetical protein
MKIKIKITNGLPDEYIESKNQNFEIVSVELLIKTFKNNQFYLHILQMQKPLIYLLQLIFTFSCPFHLISHFMPFYTIHN